jgi:hypothetical protein
VPPKTIICPDCGLVLRLTRNDAGSALIYNVKEWQGRCKRPHGSVSALKIVERKDSPSVSKGDPGAPWDPTCASRILMAGWGAESAVVRWMMGWWLPEVLLADTNRP